jgi:hypothetical protein
MVTTRRLHESVHFSAVIIMGRLAARMFWTIDQYLYIAFRSHSIPIGVPTCIRAKLHVFRTITHIQPALFTAICTILDLTALQSFLRLPLTPLQCRMRLK